MQGVINDRADAGECKQPGGTGISFHSSEPWGPCDRAWLDYEAGFNDLVDGPVLS